MRFESTVVLPSEHATVFRDGCVCHVCRDRYPVIYVLCWAFTLINGTYTIAVGQSNASFALVLLATFTSRLQVRKTCVCECNPEASAGVFFSGTRSASFLGC